MKTSNTKSELINNNRIIKKEKQYTKFCPKCKSTDIVIGKDEYLLGISPVNYICKKCGFGSKFFPEKQI